MLLFLLTPFLVVAVQPCIDPNLIGMFRHPNWKKIKCVLQVFVKQVVTSESQNKNLNILRTKRAFKMKQKPFFIFFKRISFAKSCLKPESTPWKWKKLNKWTHCYIERGQLLNYFNWMFNYFLWIVFVCFKEKNGAFT